MLQHRSQCARPSLRGLRAILSPLWVSSLCSSGNAHHSVGPSPQTLGLGAWLCLAQTSNPNPQILCLGSWLHLYNVFRSCLQCDEVSEFSVGGHSPTEPLFMMDPGIQILSSLHSAVSLVCDWCRRDRHRELVWSLRRLSLRPVACAINFDVFAP